MFPEFLKQELLRDMKKRAERFLQDARQQKYDISLHEHPAI